MRATLSKKGRITLPSAIHKQMRLKPGQSFDVIVEDEGTVVLRRVVRRPNRGLVDLLRTCPFPFAIPARDEK